MRIRAKLFSMILLLVAAFALSAATLFVVRSPIARFESEEQTLTALRLTFLNEAVEANRLAAVGFLSQLQSFESSQATTTNTFTLVEALTFLPGLDPSIKESLAKIQKLQNLLDATTASFLEAATLVQSDAVNVDSSGTVSVLRLVSAKDIDGGVSLVVRHAAAMLGQLDILTGNLKESANAIDEQYSFNSRGR